MCRRMEAQGLFLKNLLCGLTLPLYDTELRRILSLTPSLSTQTFFYIEMSRAGEKPIQTIEPRFRDKGPKKG